VRSNFLVSAPAVVDEMWFDYKGIPLKWYLSPFLRLACARTTASLPAIQALPNRSAVRFDGLHVRAAVAAHCALPRFCSSLLSTLLATLPSTLCFRLYSLLATRFSLTISFQTGFPAQTILRCPTDDTVKQYYMNVLKEVYAHTTRRELLSRC
jgi:hypothetical protein